VNELSLSHKECKFGKLVAQEAGRGPFAFHCNFKVLIFTRPSMLSHSMPSQSELQVKSLQLHGKESTIQVLGGVMCSARRPSRMLLPIAIHRSDDVTYVNGRRSASVAGTKEIMSDRYTNNMTEISLVLLHSIYFGSTRAKGEVLTPPSIKQRPWLLVLLCNTWTSMAAARWRILNPWHLALNCSI
jgi:hypothetical protein